MANAKIRDARLMVRWARLLTRNGLAQVELVKVERDPLDEVIGRRRRGLRGHRRRRGGRCFFLLLARLLTSIAVLRHVRLSMLLPGIRVHFGGKLDVRLRLLFLLLPLVSSQRGFVLRVPIFRR